MENQMIRPMTEWKVNLVKLCQLHDKRFVGMGYMFRPKSELPKDTKEMSREQYDETIGDCCAFFHKDYPEYSNGICSAETCPRMHLPYQVFNHLTSAVDFTIRTDIYGNPKGEWDVVTKEGRDKRLKVAADDFNKMVLHEGELVLMQHKRKP